MIVEIYGVTVDLILVARIVALTIFILVVWKMSVLERRLSHIEELTDYNYSDLKIKLADAIGVAEDSVDRDKERDDDGTTT